VVGNLLTPWIHDRLARGSRIWIGTRRRTLERELALFSKMSESTTSMIQFMFFELFAALGQIALAIAIGVTTTITVLVSNTVTPLVVVGIIVSGLASISAVVMSTRSTIFIARLHGFAKYRPKLEARIARLANGSAGQAAE
jgi:hypothetical protein